jgi:hypothetical protein
MNMDYLISRLMGSHRQDRDVRRYTLSSYRSSEEATCSRPQRNPRLKPDDAEIYCDLTWESSCAYQRNQLVVWSFRFHCERSKIRRSIDAILSRRS